MRRCVDLHPTIREIFKNIQKQLDAEEIEVEFCDTLERATQLRFTGKKVVMRFDMSAIESTCLFVLSRRNGILNKYIEYIFYLICAEYAFTNGEYLLAKYLSAKFDESFSILEENLSNTSRDGDWQLYLVIHAFMFAHEIGHYRYFKDKDCVSTAKKLSKWMKREADQYLDQEIKGSKIIINVLNEQYFSEELFCDVNAAVVATTIATATDICFDENNIADILLSQALVDIIKNTAMIFVDRRQPLDISHTLFCNTFRTFFSYNYLGELLKTIVTENNKEKNGDSQTQTLREVFSFFWKQVDSIYNDNLKLIVELVVNPKGVELTREEKIVTLDILRKHISLFYIDGKEYDKI